MASTVNESKAHKPKKHISIRQLADVLEGGYTYQAVYNWCITGQLRVKRCTYPGNGNAHWLIPCTQQNLRFVLRKIAACN